MNDGNIVIDLKSVVGKGYAEFWKTKKRYRIVKGGRGSKKSTTTALWFITNMMKYEGANVLVIRKIYKDHKDSTYAQLKWAINRLGVSELWDFRVSPLEIVYQPTKQKFLFRGLDDPLSITSITVEKGFLCWVWFEEFYQITNEDDFNKVDMSVRGEVPEPLFKQITGTLNPWNEKHWIKSRFFDISAENTFASTTSYQCNEFLGDDDILLFEEMRIKNPRRYEVEGLGNWGIAEGLVYNNWIEDNFNYKQLVADNPSLESAFGLDFGYTADPTALICMLVDILNKRIYMFDEHYQKGMLNNQIAEMIKYKNYEKEKIIADCAEPKSIEEIRTSGIYRIKPARKGKDSISNGIQFIQQFQLIIHPSCVYTILELNNYCWDERDGRSLNRPIDEYNHLMDAMRYGMEKFIKSNSLQVLN